MDPKPNMCEMFQENMLVNGMYNNRCLIILYVMAIMLFGPIYALCVALPTSLILGMIVQCDCFLVVMDMQIVSSCVVTQSALQVG